MITLQFQGFSRSQGVTVGPAETFTVAGNFMRDGHKNVVAKLVRHQWEVNGRFCTRWDCEGPVKVRFEDERNGTSDQHGPFKQLAVADGAVYADEKLFSKFLEETQLWHAFATENYWHAMVLTAVNIK